MMPTVIAMTVLCVIAAHVASLAYQIE